MFLWSFSKRCFDPALMTPIIKVILPSGCVLYAKGQLVDGLPQGEPTVRQLLNTRPRSCHSRVTCSAAGDFLPIMLDYPKASWSDLQALSKGVTPSEEGDVRVAEKETRTCPKDCKHTIVALWTGAVQLVIGLCLINTIQRCQSHLGGVFSLSCLVLERTLDFFFSFIEASQDLATTAMTNE